MKEWDVFISHASEDKSDIVEPLAEKLRGHGLKVWLDKTEIRLGDSLRECIDKGLAKSRFGVVVLSKAFLAKHWTTQELNGLSAREDAGHKVILPIWHELTKAELVQHSPMLADRLAANTSAGLDEVAKQIASRVLEPGSGSPSSRSPSLVRLVKNLLDGQATGNEMFTFIKGQPQIMECLTGWFGHHQILPVTVPGKEASGFLCYTNDAGKPNASLALMGPTTNPLFETPTIPVPSMKMCFQAIVEICEYVVSGAVTMPDGHPFMKGIVQSRIFGGRQAFYTDTDLYGKENISEHDVTLRSYDMIMDAAGFKGEMVVAVADRAKA